MVVTNELLAAAVRDLRESDAPCHDKWYTLDALKTILQLYYDFDGNFDFSTKTLKKAIETLGPVGTTVAGGNATGIHL